MSQHWGMMAYTILITAAIMPTAIADSQGDINSPQAIVTAALPGLDQSEAITSARSDEANIRQLTRQWFDLWSPGKEPIDWNAMSQLFAQEPGTLVSANC